MGEESIKLSLKILQKYKIRGESLGGKVLTKGSSQREEPLQVREQDYGAERLARISSPRMLTAISSGVWAMILRPMGACTLSSSAWV